MKTGNGWWSLSLTAAAVALLSVIGPAQAGPCLVSSPSSGFTGCTYEGPGPVSYSSGSVVKVHDLMLRDPIPAGTQVDSFFDVFVTIDLDPPVQRSGTAHAETSPSLWGLSPGSPVPIEMLQLQLVGLQPGMLLRESPTLPSTGQTQVTDVGGGLFRIDSFFDVFTELSLDGGQTWIPGSNSLHLELRSSAPEPGLPALLGLGLAGMLLLRRRPVICA